MGKSPSVRTFIILAALAAAIGVYNSHNKKATATTAPGHVVAYSSGADAVTVQDDNTKAQTVVRSEIDPKSNVGEKKIDSNTKVGDKGTLYYESPSGRVEFRPDPK